MREHELERAESPARATRQRAMESAHASHGHGVAAARSPALDTASVLHLQRAAGNAGVVQLLAGEEEAASPVHDVVGAGGGTPLDAGTRSTMEAAFGQSFEDVRVHTDERASRSAEAVGANAYTVGSDVVFKSGQFDTSSAAGQRTLAHELTHVVQQRSGPVDGTEAPGGIRVSDPGDRFERAAESSADQVMASVQQLRAAPAAASSTAPVAQLEEDPAAIPALQRQETPEEEEEQMG
jgi:hypothetical protein